MSELGSIPDQPQLGLRANLPQFTLLVLINAFVGAMVGMERSILPLMAEQEFGLASRTAIFSFLISFGIVKALSNFFAGRYSDIIGRKKLLVAGWVIGVPVPFMLMWAPSWSWIVVANILLGMNQGICWSTTVIMKIDLAGPQRRGFAMGLNEFAGYLAVGLVAYWTATMASEYGFRPYPMYLGIGFVLLGFLLSVFFVKETHAHAKHESRQHKDSSESDKPLTLKEIFTLASWGDKNLLSCHQAGLVNNLNDGVAWGLFPIFFASLGFSLERIGFLVALYPAVWGLAQLGTGALSDVVGRKWMVAIGMWVQSFGLWLMVIDTHVEVQVVAAILLGLGTAMVYPTLLAAVGDAAHPSWRASAVGVYRLWRDLGYAIGAIISGIVADFLGLQQAIVVVGMVTFASGLFVAARYHR